MPTQSELQSKPRCRFTELSNGVKFHIVNENFTPPKVMETEFTKLTDTTCSYERAYRSIVRQSLGWPGDDFYVAIVNSELN